MKIDQETILRETAAMSVRLSTPSGLAKFMRVMAVISLLAGLILILGAVWFTHHLHMDLGLFAHATTQAVVVENRRVEIAGRSGNGYTGHTSYLAVARFTTQNGRVMTVPDNMSFSPASFFVGQHVTIFYDPEDPQSMMIDRGWKNYLVPGFPGVMGFLALLGGVQRLYKARQLSIQAQSEAQTQPAPPSQN